MLLKKNFSIFEISRKITTNYSHYQVNKYIFSQNILFVDYQINKFFLIFFKKNYFQFMHKFYKNVKIDWCAYNLISSIVV